MAISRVHILLLIIGLGAVACLKTSTEITVKDRKLILSRFDHQKHFNVMKEMKLNCLSCHPERKSLQGVLPGEFDGKKLFCHDCHQGELAVTGAPRKCSTCHADILVAKPADHRMDWGRRHSIFAKANPLQCPQCHDQTECVNCHIQRDTIGQKVHPRTFLYVHSIEARGDPHKCGSCHVVNFCRDCHISRGVKF